MEEFITNIFKSIDWKKVRFFIFMPLIIPMVLFLHLTYDWWAGLFKDRKVLFFALSIVYVPLSLIVNASFGGWTKLAS